MKSNKSYISLLLSFIGIFLFFFVGNKTSQRDSISANFLYQGIILCYSLTVIAIGRKIGTSQYLRIGNMASPSTPNKLLGITEKDTWKSVGILFAVIITVTTCLFLYISNKAILATIPAATLMKAVLIAIPISIFNAFNEEIITRWTIVEGFSQFPKYSPLISAIVFGLPHFFGVPGGIIGSFMAGFMGWFLAKSIQDTKGIGWAVIIHTLQDIAIFTVLLSSIL